MELEKVKEGMVPSVEKTTFGRKAIDDMESMSSADEVMDSKALLIGEIPISLNCSTVSLTLPVIFKLKKGRGRLSCHAPIPGPTRLAGPNRVRVRDFLLGLFTFFFSFFFFSELNLYLWVYKKFCNNKIVYIYKRTTTGVMSIKIYTYILSPIYLYIYISNTKHQRSRKQHW